ncbi:MAG: tRNA uridine-5-carboxymethylaminomethyl(34) synthesis GTPase MnmE [Melioribacteraceae bacterium]|nr:tRNA uridine-5-carboxymethylaminomethyl(34) synthesis GTPase MnmE [Melioribacteraceae bacterium]
MFSNEDTITALATAPGIGAISVIRVSGSNSFSAVDNIFRSSKKLSDCEPNTIHYGKIYNGKNDVLDDVLVSVFQSPNSYTGEDSVEISTHGSQLIVGKIIEELMKYDVRIAEPGEFTKRAFMNGKIDLAQAEAVIDIINSRTDASLRGARNQLDGILSGKVNSLREMLVNASSLVELELDFAEEDIEFIQLDELSSKIDTVKEEIDKLILTYSFGRVIKDGVNVALVGKPNVGKSSLLNYILKESRAIVSEIPGTTRDVIREEVSIDGILFRLFDTAGIRITEDTIEKEGVLRSRKAVQDADLILLIDDITEEFSANLFNDLKNLASSERIITVGNKIDLTKKVNYNYDVLVSALTGEGINILFEKMKLMSVGMSNYTEQTAIVSNIRHYNALKRASENLIKGKESIRVGMSGEFISVDLRNAETALGEIIGKVTTDDILNNIFSKFCIGK